MQRVKKPPPKVTMSKGERGKEIRSVRYLLASGNFLGQYRVQRGLRTPAGEKN